MNGFPLHILSLAPSPPLTVSPCPVVIKSKSPKPPWKRSFISCQTQHLLTPRSLDSSLNYYLWTEDFLDNLGVSWGFSSPFLFFFLKSRFCNFKLGLCLWSLLKICKKSFISHKVDSSWVLEIQRNQGRRAAGKLAWSLHQKIRVKYWKCYRAQEPDGIWLTVSCRKTTDKKESQSKR